MEKCVPFDSRSHCFAALTFSYFFFSWLLFLRSHHPFRFIFSTQITILLAVFRSYISALSTKILINFKYSVCDASYHHFHLSAVHFIYPKKCFFCRFFFDFAVWAIASCYMRLSLFSFNFSILKHCESGGTYHKVHLCRIHFERERERTNTRRDLFPLFVFSFLLCIALLYSMWDVGIRQHIFHCCYCVWCNFMCYLHWKIIAIIITS